MSGLLLTDAIEMTPVPVEMILTLDYLQEAPIAGEQIQSWINQDQLFSQIVQLIQQGLSSTRIETLCKRCIMFTSFVFKLRFSSIQFRISYPPGYN